MRAGRNAAMGESSRGGERSIRRRNRAGGLLDVLLSFPLSFEFAKTRIFFFSFSARERPPPVESLRTAEVKHFALLVHCRAFFDDGHPTSAPPHKLTGF
mgnify:CR=1 FL=1